MAKISARKYYEFIVNALYLICIAILVHASFQLYTGENGTHLFTLVMLALTVLSVVRWLFMVFIGMICAATAKFTGDTDGRKQAKR